MKQLGILCLVLCMLVQSAALAAPKGLGLMDRSDEEATVSTEPQTITTNAGLQPVSRVPAQPSTTTDSQLPSASQEPATQTTTTDAEATLEVQPSLEETVETSSPRKPLKLTPSNDASSMAYSRHEGAGYASAEEAVLAYLEAREACDLKAMLATFAIETYVEHFQSRELLENMMVYHPMDIRYLPGSNDYMKQIQIVFRQQEIVEDLAMQYIRFLWPVEEFGDYTGKTLIFGGDETEQQMLRMAAFYSAFDVAEAEAKEAIALTFLGFEEDMLEQLDLTEVQQENYYAQLEKQRIIHGCDELVEKVARVQQGELDGYLFMCCARYGDCWYNMTSSGTLMGIFAGHIADDAGLVFTEIAD